MATIVDAKPFCDNLTREQFSGAEERAALETCATRDSLGSLGSARCVPPEENQVDCMTKFEGNAARMLEVLCTARYKFTQEVAALGEHKNIQGEDW